ncbi:S8 family serine peptidase, partial [Alphaproteobacteria bacterium]|nr:S8 family serine peptidase [Alphaproteobacteria bacterium]
PTVTLTSSASSIAENSGSSVTLTATMSTTDASNVTIAFSTTGTATEGTDYGNISNITIAAGSTTGTTSFTPTNDSTVEGNETAIIAISSVSGGNAVENGAQSQTITITDDEVAPTVTLTSSGSTIDEASGSSLTLTATLSTTSDQAVTVGLTGSGTATAGSDYSSLSNITISAGATTGTTSFTPTSDTTYETSSGGTSESATISITSVSGGSATESGTQSVTISITEIALNSGTQLTYNSTTAANYAAATEFTNINLNSGITIQVLDEEQNDNGVASIINETVSNQNSWTTINAHKVAGYGLDGTDTIIAIVDSGFETSHGEFNYKTIDTFGTLIAATSSDDHGLKVSGIAAARTGNGGVVGVAPGANLHLTDLGSMGTDGYSNEWAHMAAYTDDASTAVVQNNSWGWQNGDCKGVAGSVKDLKCEAYEIDDVKALITQYSGNTTEEILSWRLGGTTANSSDVTAAITAMNNFQDHGIIVFALQNDNKRDEAHFAAALPEIYESLKDAWITAVNIDIAGTVGNEVYSRRSGKCGSTAKYCLGADGYGITTTKYNNDYEVDYTFQGNDSNGNPVYFANHGTSWVAPMISGGVAIMAQAFPNQTPEMWADRLLASAKNTWFSHDGSVTFGDGVQHGYSTEYGHGIMDLYAALQPIVTSAYSASMRVMNQSGEIVTIPLKVSYISASSSFGDALIKSLSSKKGNFYDSLDGGFEYDLSSHILLKETDTRPFKLGEEFALLGKDFKSHNIKLQRGAKNSFTKAEDDESFFATIHSSALPVQSFTGENAPNYLGFHSDLAPYFNTKNNGVAIGGKVNTGDNSRILWGISTPMKQSESETIGKNKLTSISLENEKKGSFKNSLLFGIMEEEDTVLESELTGAFATENNTTITNFIGISSEARITDKTLFRASASVGSSELNMSYSPIIKGTSRIISDNYSMNLSHELDNKNTTAVLSVTQPNRISSGSMNVDISNLYGSDGSVTFQNHNLSLEPSGRQFDLGLGLRKKVSDDFEYILKYKNSINPGHNKDAESTHNVSAVTRFGNYKMGITTGTGEDSESLEFLYSLDF